MRVVFAVLAWMLLCGAAQAEAYKTGAPPAWVLPLAVEAEPGGKPPAARGGVAFLLRDMQSRVDQRGKITYFHTASKALDGGGVEKAANLSINFDPSYQTLTLHAINVIRDGKVIPKLAGARVQVLQRETELDYLIYDGSKTASVLLDDVRIGDIVEYAFSLDGVNPVFQGKVSNRAEMGWSVPVARSFVRLLMPSNRPVRIASQNSKLAPVLSEADGYRDYRWDQRDVAAIRVDNGAPEWYNPYAAVQWTEYQDWAAVVQWALPLYQTPREVGPALREEIARIGRNYTEPEARAAAVLRAVQRDIRYLGIEVGAGSHAPTAPDKVYQRRFGDCKDKTLLTITMLRALGIDAVPALVNTEMTRDIANWAPTPLAFNHVLVRANVHGAVYWLDPTRSEQQGELGYLYQPDYGYALVLEKGSNALSLMGPQFGGVKRIKAVFDSSDGVEQPVNYTVSTTVLSQRADTLRTQLRHNRSELETQYQNFYARSYDSLRSNGAMDVQDDEAHNELTTVEHYNIPGFWSRNDKRKRSEASVEASEIDHPLKAPDAVSRNAPLRLDYPYEVIEDTEVRLPERWNLKTSVTEVRDPAFEFSYKVSKGNDGRSLQITARYKALRDHVAPEDMANYAAHLKQARDAVGYQLYSQWDAAGAAAEEPASKRGAGYFVLGMLVLLPAWIWLGVRMQRAAPAHAEVNRRLLLVVVMVSGLLAICLLLPVRPSKVLPSALVLLAIMTGYLLRTVPQVPSTHIAYPWALRIYRARNHTTPLVARALLRKALPLIGWFAIGSALASLLS
ncbi:DUF3857 domain-containing protein [Duganella sp. FT80W]|uniref:DUF3857 domain-containing protein n=1 Tax=Duganella guangzhouensis TaxID=2666084 RepID=A0A6I2KY78_9BURK|nr:DUF3857 domain-containing transglutaminase family protein [Duganella guangzhouensis]MRW90771.1 DUF3857 domain-containing protein [Duganella guangzhouensis]